MIVEEYLRDCVNETLSLFGSEVEFDMYAPGIEKAGEEREVFLEVSNECMEYNESKQVIVVEDTNTKVGIREVDNITGSL